MTKVQKARVQKLVDALRSRKYKQGVGRLRIDDKFCCLGVACDISGLGKWEQDPVYGQWSYTVKGKNAENESHVMPERVFKYFGFDDQNPTLQPHASYESAAEMNDYGHSKFKTIATAFEKAFLK